MISVVIPLHDERPVLPELVRRLTAAADTWDEPAEFIAVDDGSTDGTAALVRQTRSRDERWRLVRLSRNFGHQAAISAGLESAVGDAVVVMDGDLQDPPEFIAELLARWQGGADVVVAVRRRRAGPLWKRLAYAAFYRLWRRFGPADAPVGGGDFCLMDRRVVRVLVALPERSRFVRGLRHWAGFRQELAPYDRPARAAGEPSFTLAKLVRLAEDGLFGCGRPPVRLALWVALASAGTGAAAATVLTAYALLAASWGAALAAAAVGGLGAVVATQFALLYMIGEMCRRTTDEVRGRPAWVVAEQSPAIPVAVGAPASLAAA